MRTFIVTFVIVCGALAIPATNANGSAAAVPMISAVAVLDGHAASPAPASVEPAQGAEIKVDINKGGGSRAWYASPVWVAIGGIALVLVILLIVMASRGGGTTVVRG